MKKMLLIGLMLASFNSFSQSYLVLNNGVTLTLDKAGFVYDFGHFSLPYKVESKGLNYFLEDKKLMTVDSLGFLYEKSEKYEDISGTGGNFFFNDDQLITIDVSGFFYKFENKIFSKVSGIGGNYFLVKPVSRFDNTELYTVNDKGNYFKINIEGLDALNIIPTKGNYFQTRRGQTYTVSKEGFVFLKTDMQIGSIVKAGGNYFIDSKGFFFTVSDAGLLLRPILPSNFNVSELKSFGANYMIDVTGRMFVVDSFGNIVERIVNHDLRNAKIFSL